MAFCEFCSHMSTLYDLLPVFRLFVCVYMHTLHTCMLTWRSTIIIICHNMLLHHTGSSCVESMFLVFLFSLSSLYSIIANKESFLMPCSVINLDAHWKYTRACTLFMCMYIRFSSPISSHILICQSKPILWHSIENVFNTWANSECFRCITRALFPLNSLSTYGYLGVCRALLFSHANRYSITQHTHISRQCILFADKDHLSLFLLSPPRHFIDMLLLLL